MKIKLSKTEITRLYALLNNYYFRIIKNIDIYEHIVKILNINTQTFLKIKIILASFILSKFYHKHQK